MIALHAIPYQTVGLDDLQKKFHQNRPLYTHLLELHRADALGRFGEGILLDEQRFAHMKALEKSMKVPSVPVIASPRVEILISPEASWIEAYLTAASDPHPMIVRDKISLESSVTEEIDILIDVNTLSRRDRKRWLRILPEHYYIQATLLLGTLPSSKNDSIDLIRSFDYPLYDEVDAIVSVLIPPSS